MALGTKMVLGAREQVQQDNATKVDKLTKEAGNAESKAQHFEAEAESLRAKEESAFTGDRMHAKGRAAWTMIRQHAREAEFRAKDERETADAVHKELRDAKAFIPPSSSIPPSATASMPLNATRG